MASAREQMKTITEELNRVRSEIEQLRHEERILVRLLAKLSGESEPTVDAFPVDEKRNRAANIKPIVLDLVHAAGLAGITSQEVATLVKEKVPDVAKDTVGSTLSRLKGQGAFVYENERYYEKQFAPSRTPFTGVQFTPPPWVSN